MGKALTVGAIDAGAVASTDVVAFDIFSTALDSLVAERGVSTADSIAGVATSVDVLLLAVKPHDVPGVLQQIRDSGSDTKSLLVISVAAGLPIARLEQEVGEGARAALREQLGLHVWKAQNHVMCHVILEILMISYCAL